MIGVEREPLTIPPAPARDGDLVTIALFADVTALLEWHGYRLPVVQDARHRALAHTLAALAELVAAFEGCEIPTAEEADDE